MSIKEKIVNDVDQLALKLTRDTASVTPALKTKILFYIMRHIQQNGKHLPDVTYWKEKGWLGKARPWKKAAQKTGQEN